MRDRSRDTYDINDHMNIAEDRPLPADQVVAESEYEMIRQALQTLPPEQQQVVNNP